MSGLRRCSLLLLLAHSVCSSTHLTPKVTRGQVWPLPQYISSQQSFLHISPKKFHFKIANHTCDILEKAVERYTALIRNSTAGTRLHSGSECRSGDCGCGSHRQDTLGFVTLQLNNPCQQWPHLKMNEQYELHVNSLQYEGVGLITSDSVWGALRGLETFSQLVSPASCSCCLMVNSTDVLDYPRFPHRGLLLDTGRHFLPLDTIYTILSAMEANKMNVFHWHIIDDQSFPYQSQTFPSLSGQGAFTQKLIYTQENVKSILDFARLRGIRVIPEFDSPGHTQSWGKGVNKLLTPCFSNQTFNGEFGPIDPSREQNFKFMKSLLKEVHDVFPDGYIHIGGDEVDYDCWKSNPAISNFMKEKNIEDYPALEAYYIRRVLDLLNGLGASGIVWQEVFQHKANLRNDTIVQIWMGNRTELLNEVTSKGYFALLSDGWYLDHLADEWHNFYAVDPTDFNGTKAQTDLVLGGEACMWGEMVDESNIVSRTWPRASAAAERLWSSKSVKQASKAGSRLNEHVCRMRRRGISAQPANGPGFCPY